MQNRGNIPGRMDRHGFIHTVLNGGLLLYNVVFIYQLNGNEICKAVIKQGACVVKSVLAGFSA